MTPVKCLHCNNAASNEGMCYSHWVATKHKNITAQEHRKMLTDAYYQRIKWTNKHEGYPKFMSASEKGYLKGKEE